MGIANDKNNDVNSREMQYLVPPAPHINVSTPDESAKAHTAEEHHIPRNVSTGTLQESQLHRQLSRTGSSGSILALSRRPSATVAAMQRPCVQRTILMEYVRDYYQPELLSIDRYQFELVPNCKFSVFSSLLNGRMLGGSKSSIRAHDDFDDDFVHLEADPDYEFRMRNRRLGDDALTTALSAFYAKLVVVLGIAFPITDILGAKTPNVFYQGFYLYLYIVSVTFVAFMYMTRTMSRNKMAKSGRAKG